MILALAQWGINKSFHISIEFSFPGSFLTRRGGGVGEHGSSSVTNTFCMHILQPERERVSVRFRLDGLQGIGT